MAWRRDIAIGVGRDTARYAWLLAALILSLALPPLLLATEVRIPSLRIGLAAVLIGSLVVVSRGHRTLWLGLSLAVPAVVLDWASLLAGSAAFAMAGSAFAAAFLLVVICALVASLLRAERVTADTILGGICVYLLLGLLWVSAFTLVEISHPGSLLLAGAPLPSGPETLEEPFRHSEILYFSFVTLTTVGYGDVAPAIPATRALAAGEAIVGQLYVAIFVARLVGLHLAHTRNRDDR